MSEPTEGQVYTFGEDTQAASAITDPGNGKVQAPSFLDELQQELTKEVRKDDIVLAVELRNNIAVRYDPNIDMHYINHWRDRSMPKGRGRDADPDPLHFSLLVVRHSCQSIVYKGMEVDDGQGNRITINSPLLKEWTSMIDPVAAIKHFYGSDSQVLGHAQRVLEAGGYTPEGQVVTEVDDEHPLDG